MSKQIQVVLEILLIARPKAFSFFAFVKSLSWYDCVPMLRTVNSCGVFALATIRVKCETCACVFSVEGELWNVVGRFGCWSI